jgi:fluoride exporter
VERVLLVALGGAIGTTVRFVTATVAARWLGPDFPYGTLAVNLAGAFAVGVVQQLALGGAAIPETARLFLTTGLLGGLTTYSAFSYETVRLAQTGAWAQAWLNLLVTTSLSLTLCVLGMAVGRLLLAR